MTLLPCPVCKRSLEVRQANGRKSKKPFIQLVCAADGRHFRGFICDQQFIARVAGNAESEAPGR